MAITGNPIDPRGIKRPNKDLILVFTHTFRPVIAIERPYKVCFPSDIYLNNIYSIFSLFFTTEVLTIIIKNINTYGARHYRYLKTLWQDILVTELRAFLNILTYRSLYLYLRHKDFWNIDLLKPIHIGLIKTLSYDYFA